VNFGFVIALSRTMAVRSCASCQKGDLLGYNLAISSLG